MNKSKMPLIIVGILVIVAIVAAVFVFTGDDNETTTPDSETTNGQEQNGETSNGENEGEGEDGSDGEETGTTSDVASVKASLETLAADFDAAIEAGCGDDIDAFNAKVTDLVTRYGPLQQEVVNLANTTASVEEVTELSTLGESIDDKNEQLAELSNTCNAAATE